MLSIIIVTQIICGILGPHDMTVEAYARVLKQGEVLQSNNTQEGNNSKHQSQATSQLKGRAIQSSFSDLPQQQNYQYLMKPHSQGNKMIVYPSSYEISHRNDMTSNIDQDIRRLKKPLPKPQPSPMKSGYKYMKPSTEKPETTTTTPSSYFLPTVIPENHALYFNKDYLPPDMTHNNDFPIDEMSLAISKNNIKDELMKEMMKHPDIMTPEKNLFPPKSEEASESLDLTLFPPNHQSSYDSPSAEVKNPIGTSYIPPASGPVKVYPVYTPNENQTDQSIHAFPPNINVTYKGNGFKLHPGTSYIPLPSGIPGEIKPQGFKPRPYLPPKEQKEMKRPHIDYLPPKLEEINDMRETNDNNNVFPPNLNSNYKDVKEKTKNGSPVTSYLPPPSGNVETKDESSEEMMQGEKGSQAFPPNIDIEYLPPEMTKNSFAGNSYVPPASGNVHDPSYMYLPPVSYLPPKTTPKPTTSPPVTKTTQTTVKPPVMISYLPPSASSPPPPPPPMMLPTPVPQYLPPDTPKPMMMMPPDMSKPPMMMPAGPPMMMPQMSKPPGMPWDGMFPHDSDIVFEDPHHDFHDHHHDIITTTPPPPPPPPKSIKKFGHYYILIKLWYVPLLFTIWFSFYIAYILLKSLGRHKAYWPNHTSLRKRSISTTSPLEALSSLFPVDTISRLSHKEITQRTDDLTCRVKSYIDSFMCKYL